MQVKVGTNKLCVCFWIILLLLLSQSDPQTAVVSLGTEAWKLSVCVWVGAPHMCGSKGLALKASLTPWHCLEFWVCSVVTKVLLTLNKEIFFFNFLKNFNQSFLSFSDIFHECKCTKIRLFGALPNFSASLKFQINVVSVLIPESVWLVSWKKWRFLYYKAF